MLVYGKTFRAYYNLQHDILHRSTHSLSTTTPLAIGASFFSIVSLLTSNKIIGPLLAQCKATQNTFAWAHCMFFADQVSQFTWYTGSFQYPKWRLAWTTVLIAAKFIQLRSWLPSCNFSSETVRNRFSKLLLSWVSSWKPGVPYWKRKWWLRWDSNPHFADFKSVDSAVGLLSHSKNAHNLLEIAIPVKGKNLVVHKRIELLLIGWKPTVLTTRRMDRFGGPDGLRTHNLSVINWLLCSIELQDHQSWWAKPDLNR